MNAYPTPSLPSGWTVKQCLGSVLTDGSANVRAFSQVGAEFLLATSGSISSMTVSVTNTAQLWQGLSPVGIKATVRVRASNVGSTGVGMIISSPDQTDEDPNTAVDNYSTKDDGKLAGEYFIRTNTSAQIRLRSHNTWSGELAACGWTDPRRRLF